MFGLAGSGATGGRAGWQGDQGEQAVQQEVGLLAQIDALREVQPVDDVAIQSAVQQGGGLLQIQPCGSWPRRTALPRVISRSRKKLLDWLRMCSRKEMASPSSDSRLNMMVNIC